MATNDVSTGSSERPLAGLGRRLLRMLLIAALAALVAVELWTCLVQVDEGEYAIVERFGEIVSVYDRPDDRGLHFKLPWPIDSVRRFDRRVQYFDPPGREMFTRDKKNILVDAYVCWKIAEPANSDAGELTGRPVVRFFRALGTVSEAEKRIDSRVRSIVNTRFGQIELSELLHVSDSTSGPAGRAGMLDQIAREVEDRLTAASGENGSIEKAWGIEIVDVRIKRPNLPAGNRQAVYDRMRSERRKFADEYRNAGMSENKLIRSLADKQHDTILAKAKGDAEKIRGRADAEALGILNAAHAQDPEFYRVLRTLDTYRRILGEKTTLVLSASSNLLKLLTEGVPELEAPPPKPGISPTGQTSNDAPNGLAPEETAGRSEE